MIINFEKFKMFEEGDGGGVANATLGNTGGMGAIVAPIVSPVPGDVASSTPGSGDLPATSGTMFPPMKLDYINKYKSKKKKKKSRIKKFSDFK